MQLFLTLGMQGFCLKMWVVILSQTVCVCVRACILHTQVGLHTCDRSSPRYIAPAWTSIWHILGNGGASLTPRRTVPPATFIIHSAFKCFHVSTQTSQWWVSLKLNDAKEYSNIRLILRVQETRDFNKSTQQSGENSLYCCELSHLNNYCTWPWAATTQFSCYLISLVATSMWPLSINNATVEN
jgi:hypothetical protein